MSTSISGQAYKGKKHVLVSSKLGPSGSHGCRCTQGQDTEAKIAVAVGEHVGHPDLLETIS